MLGPHNPHESQVGVADTWTVYTQEAAEMRLWDKLARRTKQNLSEL